MKLSTIAIYPGTFDPLTNGHLDLIKRGSAIFDKLIVAISLDTRKTPLFSPEERKEMIELVIKGITNVEVDIFKGLLVEYARKKKANIILRGVRAFSDFEYEFQMALMNRKLEEKIETIFMMPNEAYSYVSSNLIKEVCLLGGDISHLVPEVVYFRLKQKLLDK